MTNALCSDTINCVLIFNNVLKKMTIPIEQLEDIVRQAFPNAVIKITDIAGDQNHYSLEIADKAFHGLTLLAQHRIVKAALSDILHEKLHALTIKTKSL